MQRYLDVFNALKASHEQTFATRHRLQIKTGFGLNAAILKLLKPEWTTDGPTEILNTNGLFFSVWVDPACEASGIARFNLHAKKLRVIKGAAFAAREFARSFRVRADLKGWPNITFPKGPITLFEGHVPLDINTLQAETSALMDQFAALCPFLEEILAERRED
jgi:hypothetical protein